jgi:N,N'-diacetyllegionaminate synthase
MNPITIGDKRIGSSEPVFIIAEAGVNHNGDLDVARQLVDAAVDAGADAVKFQTFKADRVASPSAPKAEYQLRTTGTTASQLEMIRSLELSHHDHYVLRDHCQSKGIIFLSTPFDESSADLLEELGVPVFKIPSGEITNIPFLEYVAKKRKPLILSTGMSWLSEVDEAVRVVRSAGAREIALLHCVSNYPAEPADVNLRAMQSMASAMKLLVGISDHTSGTEVAIAAVAMGARLVEKHFTLDCNMPGPDHKASLEPHELKSMVSAIRRVELALGHGRKEPAASEMQTAAVARRSLVSACLIEAGTVLTKEMVEILRPGTGMSPSMLPYVIGRTTKIRISSGTLLSPEMLV